MQFAYNKKEVFAIVTLKDIANACNVSVSTASRAFDQSSKISQPIRQRILKCASELGYTPNLIARSLKNSRTMTIAITVPSLENRFFIDVLQHLEIALYQCGYRLLVTFIQDGVVSERECLEIAASAQVDGLILLPYNKINEQYIESLSDQCKIIQLFNAPYEQFDSVVMDDEGGAEAGANYLFARGHRRIIYADGQDRIAGLWRAVDAAGIPRDDILTLPRSITVDELCDIIPRFQPTAFFSIAHTSEKVWKAVRRLGLSIPDDISMMVYDDTQWVGLVELTAVAHDLEAITAVLVEQLMQRLSGDNTQPPKHLVLDPFIVERTSVRDLY